MKRYFLLIAVAFLSLCAAADDFSPIIQAQWVGAITRADARIPEGRNFSGGKLKGEAKALWDAVDTLSRRSIIVGKTVKVGKSVAKATLSVCGLGFYELQINGRRVGESVMAPLWSDYDKTVFYNDYDVTDFFRKGNNRIEALLGNGFYNEQGGRYAKLRISFGPPTLRLGLRITYTDGSEKTILTDNTWQWRPSPITFNSLYGGEDYDARLEKAVKWRPVVVQEGPRGQLREQLAEPVKLMERFSVKAVLKAFPPQTTADGASAGSKVYDMGQNLAGFPEITVRGKAGQRVKITVGETLTDDGHVNQRQTGRPHYYIYTLKGGDRETWHPRFSYYGFRYIEVETEAELLDLQSCFIYNSARKTGDFECSNQLFNDAYRIIDRAIRSNWQSVWTDCPHREKLGWLEQDWLNGEGLVYNYDARTMIEQTMQNIVDAQHADGSMPEIAPEYTVFEGSWAKPFLESPEWGGAIMALPMLFLQHYGDDRLIHQHYEAMKRYVDYLHTQDSCYILKQGLGDWYDYGEGRAGFSKNTPMPLVSTAHYYLWTNNMAVAAQLLSKEADATVYEQRAAAIREAFNREFFDPKTCQYGTGSQCSNAIPLAMGLAEDSLRDGVLANLVADIHAHGDRLTTGDVGNRYLFDALTAANQHELLYRMLNHDDVPGYGYQIKKGHTTLTEQWNPEHGASMNHFMMGHINNLLIPEIVGIRVMAGRFVEITPHPVGDLTWSRGSTEVSSGRISVFWKREAGRFSIDVELPQDLEATVFMPFSNGEAVQAVGGKNHFEVEIPSKTDTTNP
ncbi:MAG: family 78 glycoside hydrolase catalytic domain [Prevotella sp.]|nr:family 78 glycoside hydrolase catalytic domain [Prevotella sp.]